jgi:hypothetical protein
MNIKPYHAEERGKERLNLSPESVSALQRAADKMWYSGGYKKLTGKNYYSNIRDPRQNLLGYAAYKVVGGVVNRPRLILASILSKNMRPRGSNISTFFNERLLDNKVKLNVPTQFDKFPKMFNN